MSAPNANDSLIGATAEIPLESTELIGQVVLLDVELSHSENDARMRAGCTQESVRHLSIKTYEEIQTAPHTIKN